MENLGKAPYFSQPDNGQTTFENLMAAGKIAYCMVKLSSRVTSEIMNRDNTIARQRVEIQSLHNEVDQCENHI